MEKKVLNLKPYFEYEVFKPLKIADEFNKVFIDFGTVWWENGADLSRDTLYIKGNEYDENYCNNTAYKEKRLGDPLSFTSVILRKITNINYTINVKQNTNYRSIIRINVVMLYGVNYEVLC